MSASLPDVLAGRHRIPIFHLEVVFHCSVSFLNR